MSSREQYVPGAASGAEVRKDGEKWMLVLVRDLAQPPTKVWEALTDPVQLLEWAPFDSDRNLGAVGSARLSTVGAPTADVSETDVKRADAPKALEYTWGGADIRWELEPLEGGGTRLTLRHTIDRGFISMGAADRLCATAPAAGGGSVQPPRLPRLLPGGALVGQAPRRGAAACAGAGAAQGVGHSRSAPEKKWDRARSGIVGGGDWSRTSDLALMRRPL